MTALTTEIKKSHTQMALMTLESYVHTVLRPYWQAKTDKLPERHRNTRTAGLYRTHWIDASQAISDLKFEIEKMPDDN